MEKRATQLTILQMAGNAVRLLEADKNSAIALPQMILAAEESTMEARWEDTENLPDRELQLARLINAAANCIRAAAVLAPSIDPMDFARMQVELMGSQPAQKQSEPVTMPPVTDFVEEPLGNGRTKWN